MMNLRQTVAWGGFVSIMALSAFALPNQNQKVLNFSKAKKLAAQIHQEHPYTIYCNCRYQGKEVDLQSCGYIPKTKGKDTGALNWEHVVPAESFGQSFVEWRQGAPRCQKKNGRKFRGRKCAETNPEFSRMEGDLFNLWPEVAELNRLRSNFNPAELGAEGAGKGDFGGCKAKIESRKFEPMKEAKGRVARTYLYMDQAYPGRGVISEKNRPLFEVWNQLHPVDAWECRRYAKIKEIQRSENPVLKEPCALLGQKINK